MSNCRESFVQRIVQWPPRAVMFIGVLMVLSLGSLAIINSAHARRETEQRGKCAQRLRAMYVGLENYIGVRREFPPAYVVGPGGGLHHSWRFLLVHPIVQYRGFGPSVKDPWQVVAPMMEDYESAPFCCTRRNQVSYLALTGPGTAFSQAARLEGQAYKLDPPGINFHKLPHDLIIIVEVRDSGIHWLKPKDLDVSEIAGGINTDPVCGISSVHKGGAHVLFRDGTVWFLHNDAPFEDVRKFFTIEGAEQYDRDELLWRYHD